MFCQLQELSRSKSTRPNAVKKTLEALPATLDKTYERMLTRIDIDDRSYALTLLRWLVYSYEPLTLEKLAEASIIDPTANPTSDGLVDVENKGDWADTLELLAGLVVTAVDQQDEIAYHSNDSDTDSDSDSDGDSDGGRDSDGDSEGGMNSGSGNDNGNADETAHDEQSSALDIDNELDRSLPNRLIHKHTIIRLAHFSVKEYLESSRIVDSDAHYFQFDIGREHRFLTQSCLVYLAHYSNSLQKRSSRRDLESFPLLSYTARRWWDHAKEQTYEGVTREIRFLTNDQMRQDCLRVWRPDQYQKSPFSVDHTDEITQPALPYASYCNLKEVVEGLIAAGQQLGVQTVKLGSALHAAAGQGHETMCRFLIDKGADVNLQGGEYGSVLYAAANRGSEVIVRLLLDVGSDVNMQGGRYGSPLHVATHNGSEVIVRLLLDAGADADAQNDRFETALQVAAHNGAEVIFHWLLDAGADVKIQGGEYGSALQAAVKRNSESIVRSLLAAGADANVQGGDYGSAIQLAAHVGSETIVRLLLDAGADPNLQSGFAKSALQEAVFYDRGNIARLLLNAGADANFASRRFGGALQAAALHSNESMIHLLLDAGADGNSRGGRHISALQAAVQSKNPEATVRLILDAKAIAARSGSNRLCAAMSEGGVITTPSISDMNADINAALMTAAASGIADVVECLLDAGADVNARDEFYDTPLHKATSRGFGRFVQLLLNAGANILLVDGRGRSALVIAYSVGAWDVVDTLKQKTPDVPCEMILREALIAAASHCRMTVVKALLDAGADAAFINEHGMTALVEVSRRGHEGAVGLLLDSLSDDPRKLEVCQKALVAASGGAGHTEVVRIIAKALADIPSQGEPYYQEALFVAVGNGYIDITQILLKAIAHTLSGGTYWNILVTAARMGRKKMVKLIMECPQEPPSEEFLQEALIEASRQGYAKAVDISSEETTNISDGETLMGAFIRMVFSAGHADVVRMLVKMVPRAQRQAIYQVAMVVAPLRYRPDNLRILSQATDDATHVQAYRKALVDGLEPGHKATTRPLLDADAHAVDPVANSLDSSVDGSKERRNEVHSLTIRSEAESIRLEYLQTVLDTQAGIGASDDNGYSVAHIMSPNSSVDWRKEAQEEVIQMLLQAGAKHSTLRKASAAFNSSEYAVTEFDVSEDASTPL